MGTSSGRGYPLRVGSYNVLIPRDDRPNKAQESWEKRRAAVIETIEVGFDLVGLQECSTFPPHRQAGYIVEKLTDRGWTGYLPWEHKLFDDPFHERIPIFWRPALFELLDAGQLLLSSWTNEELAEVPILENRYASFVKLLHRESQQVVWFYTLHLQHETSRATEREAELAQEKREQGEHLVADHIHDHVALGETVILGGDFNAVDVSPYLHDRAGLEDVANLASVVKNWQRNSFHNWDHPLEGKHIDHMLIGGPARVEEAEIVHSNASDHHPVRAVIEL